MVNTKKLIDKLSESEIKSITEAHQYSWSQTGILCLITSYISDIRNDRENVTYIEHRAVSLEGFMINGKAILSVINEIRFSKELYESYLLSMAKNFFRGTAHPIYEISNNPKVKQLIASVCFENQTHFQNFIDILSVIRHFLSHNYTEKVILKNWDMKKDSTIAQLKKDHCDEIISFNYNGTKYFPEVYKENEFEINISLDLSKINIALSLFDAISIKELFFLGELCNNSMKKALDVINEQNAKA